MLTSVFGGCESRLSKYLINFDRQTLPALSNVPGIVLNDFMAPLQFVSLACLIAGGIIIVTSIVYPGVNPAKNAKGEIGPTAKESMVDSQL